MAALRQRSRLTYPLRRRHDMAFSQDRSRVAIRHGLHSGRSVPEVSFARRDLIRDSLQRVSEVARWRARLRVDQPAAREAAATPPARAWWAARFAGAPRMPRLWPGSQSCSSCQRRRQSGHPIARSKDSPGLSGRQLPSVRASRSWPNARFTPSKWLPALVHFRHRIPRQGTRLFIAAWRASP